MKNVSADHVRRRFVADPNVSEDDVVPRTRTPAPSGEARQATQVALLCPNASRVAALATPSSSSSAITVSTAISPRGSVPKSDTVPFPQVSSLGLTPLITNKTASGQGTVGADNSPEET